MAIKKIELPIYDSTGVDSTKAVIIREFAGRMTFEVVTPDDKQITRFECYFDDLKRAWQAVKKY